MTAGNGEQITITAATRPELGHVRELFVEYVSWLGLDLSFQGFEEELASLPGKYGPPDGTLLLARAEAQAGRQGNVAGCVAVRRFSEQRCEMKRLWVRPEFRGFGIGRRLAAAAIDHGRATGYRSMVLDSLESMAAAVSLYESMGFGRIPPYYHNPIPDAVYLSLDL